MFSKARILVSAAAVLFIVSTGTLGCATVTRTNFDTIAIGGPVWLQRTIRTDHVTMFGRKTIDTEIGFVYCENVDGQGPVCVPVDVKKIPRNMTWQAWTIENGLVNPAAR